MGVSSLFLVSQNFPPTSDLYLFRGSVSDFTRLQEGSGGGGGGVDCLVLHRPCPHIDMVMLVCQPFIKVTI